MAKREGVCELCRERREFAGVRSGRLPDATITLGLADEPGEPITEYYEVCDDCYEVATWFAAEEGRTWWVPGLPTEKSERA